MLSIAKKNQGFKKEHCIVSAVLLSWVQEQIILLEAPHMVRFMLHFHININMRLQFHSISLQLIHSYCLPSLIFQDSRFHAGIPPVEAETYPCKTNCKMLFSHCTIATFFGLTWRKGTSPVRCTESGPGLTTRC
jgi:hypothetical protein